jgi:hypothetical protein
MYRRDACITGYKYLVVKVLSFTSSLRRLAFLMKGAGSNNEGNDILNSLLDSSVCGRLNESGMTESRRGRVTS